VTISKVHVFHRVFDDFGSDVFGSPSGVLYQRHLQPSCGLHVEQGILYICRDAGTLVVDKRKTLLTGFHNSRATHSDLTSTVASHAGSSTHSSCSDCIQYPGRCRLSYTAIAPPVRSRTFLDFCGVVFDLVLPSLQKEISFGMYH
jgi:hypothetical protein